jgi:acyl-coenzyme A thioesterase 13
MTNQELTARQAPPGWVLQSHPQTFSAQAGPFYFRERGKVPGVGFFAEPHHANLGGIVHGGALMTLADMSLWDICRRVEGDFKAVTVTMNAEFIGAGPIGVFIEATGEMTKAGRSLLFARGLVTADGKSLLSFSGTLKRLS